MTNWFLKLIGASDEFSTHLDKVTLAFQHSAVLWLLLLLPPVGYYIYRRQRTNLMTVPTRLVAALTATRLIVLLLLILVLAGPYLKLDHQIEKKPIVAVVFDHSQSMTLPAGPFPDDQLDRVARAAGYQTSADSSSGAPLDAEARKALNRIARAKLAQTAVQNAREGFLDPVAEKYDLRMYSFAREATPLAVDAKTLEIPEPPTPGGPSSYVGDALNRVLEEAGGRPVAGIVLLTDGMNTGGRSPAEAALAAARLKAPIFAVPTGDPRRKSDVAIVDVFTSGLVSVGDTVRVAATFESRGFEGRPVTVELREGDSVLASKELVLHNEQQQLELTFEARSPGPKYLSVVVPAQPEEPEELRGNNTDVAFVRISDEKIKVLLLDGGPRWDFRFLKNAMRRDHGLGGRTEDQPDIAVETELRRRPEGASGVLPATLDELAEYHTVILGDCSPELLHTGFLELLGKAVRERGVGLVVAAGPQHMPHSFEDSFTDLLPVKLQPRAAGGEADAYNPFRLEVTPEGDIHEALRLYDDPGRNRNVWSSMPPFYWSAAVQRAAPAATVLAVNASRKGRFGKLPLVAWHYAGDGKVMFIGTDSTWLWRQNVGDRFFYRFWGQTIRFVARRNPEDLKKSRIEVRPVRAQPGEEALIELTALTPDGTPRTDPKLPVTIQGQDGTTTIELIADPVVKGRYRGGFTPQLPGDYRVGFQPGSGESVEAQFRVTVAPEEFRHPHVDRDALAALAASSGGRLVEIDELATIPAELRGEVRQTPLHREATVWDNWLTLVLLVGVYSIDVGLRRLAGLS
jgi:hypothetical protein